MKDMCLQVPRSDRKVWITVKMTPCETPRRGYGVKTAAVDLLQKCVKEKTFDINKLL